jgi:hypothetical protein
MTSRVAGQCYPLDIMGREELLLNALVEPMDVIDDEIGGMALTHLWTGGITTAIKA